MPKRAKANLPLLLVCVIAASVWLPTLGWGLPSREADRYLFGERRPWSGAEILDLLGERERPLPLPLAGGGGGVGQSNSQRAESPTTRELLSADAAPPPNPLPQAGGGTRGADVDANPILDRSKPVVLNDTDAKRAEIVQRYRLMSGQPDEFIQFKALAEMSSRSGLSKLDPRLYQYGGLWIYPVGALVRGAMVVGLIEGPPPGVSAREFYLDHPEAFGRFYVVARAYSATWGFVALVAIYWLARRITGVAWLAALAALMFALLPVVRTATHEAKPHLAGAALCLCAVIAATKYAETGRRRWLLIAGMLCGAAMGMVVSMLTSIVVLPAAVIVRRKFLPLPLAGGGRGVGLANSQLLESPTTREPLSSDIAPPPNPLPQAGGGTGVALLASVACAMLVYAITNPFVLYNAIANPALLKSNLGNSTAMYGVGGITASIVNAGRVAGVGMLTILFACLLVAISVALSKRDGRARLASPASLLLLAAGLVIAIQFVALAAGKPAEYARFGLVTAAMLCALAPLALRGMPRPATIFLCLVVSVVLLIPAVVTVVNRHQLTSASLAFQLQRSDGQVCRVYWPPAPWSALPMDLFTTRIELIDPRNERAGDELYPENLASQIDPASVNRESTDWRDNKFAGYRMRSSTTQR